MPKAGVDNDQRTGSFSGIKELSEIGKRKEREEILLEIMTEQVSMELEAGRRQLLDRYPKKGMEKLVPVTEVISYLR